VIGRAGASRNDCEAAEAVVDPQRKIAADNKEYTTARERMNRSSKEDYSR
jgi:hypothetical protein